MMRLSNRPVVDNDNLTLELGEGETTAQNMGCSIVVVDQVDHDTKRNQRVVLTKADLEAMLAWLA
jgi:hypothetical protein